MPPPLAHLPRREIVLRMARKARIAHALDLRVAFEEARDFERVRRMPLHAERQGAQAAQREKAAERIEHAAGGVLQEAQPVDEIGVVAHDRGAADDVGMAADVFGHRMDDDVEAELQRPLHRGRSEGIVGDRDQAALSADLGDRREVGDAQQRIAGRLDPDHPRRAA